MRRNAAYPRGVEDEVGVRVVAVSEEDGFFWEWLGTLEDWREEGSWLDRGVVPEGWVLRGADGEVWVEPVELDAEDCWERIETLEGVPARERLETDEGSAWREDRAAGLTRIDLTDLFDHLLDDDGYGWRSPRGYLDEIGVDAYLAQLDEAVARDEEAGPHVRIPEPFRGEWAPAPQGAAFVNGGVVLAWGDALLRLEESGGEARTREIGRLMRPADLVYAEEGCLVFQVVGGTTYFAWEAGEWRDDVDPVHVESHWIVGPQLWRDGVAVPFGHPLVGKGSPVQLGSDGRTVRVLREERPVFSTEDGRWLGPAMVHRCRVMGPERRFGVDARGRIVEADDGRYVRVDGWPVHRLRIPAERVDVSPDGSQVVATDWDAGIEWVRLGEEVWSTVLSVPTRMRFAHVFVPRAKADADGGYISHLFDMLGENERVDPRRSQGVV